jgi:hypothetical protein
MKHGETPSSLIDMVETRSADGVRKLAKLAVEVISRQKDVFWVRAHIGHASSQRKSDLAPMLVKIMKNEEAARILYSRLDETEKAAVQEAVSDSDGIVDSGRFIAKYGRSPYPSKKEKESQSLLPLFIYSGIIPHDLKEVLRNFVPVPPEAEARYDEKLPDEVVIQDKKVRLVAHQTEPAALHDVSAILHLINNGRVGASAATGYVTGSGASAVREVLLNGDYYPEDAQARHKYDVGIGEQGIRPFAWCVIMQAGRLAKIEGGKLRLTRKGQEALTTTPHLVLKELWGRWLENNLLHEMNRIDIIKGQKSKGNPLYRADSCREAIGSALYDLTPGRWLKTVEFFRFLTARGHVFTVARDPWKLYISDSRYGSLGYSHITWNHIEGRFATAFLLEYVATMGVIDVALVPPWGAAADMGDLWGADEYSCLSRYDGLVYLRLTPLGAWILGKTDTYSPASPENMQIFKILPNLEIAVTSHITSADKLFLDRIAGQKSGNVWELSRSKILQAIEKNMKFGVIKDFLLSRTGGKEIPQPVEVFLNDIKERSEKLRDGGAGRIIECVDADTAALIANDPSLKKLCLPAGDRYLVVPSEKETAFRAALRKMGYVVSG